MADQPAKARLSASELETAVLGQLGSGKAYTAQQLANRINRIYHKTTVRIHATDVVIAIQSLANANKVTFENNKARRK